MSFPRKPFFFDSGHLSVSSEDPVLSMLHYIHRVVIRPQPPFASSDCP